MTASVKTVVGSVVLVVAIGDSCTGGHRGSGCGSPSIGSGCLICQAHAIGVPRGAWGRPVTWDVVAAPAHTDLCVLSVHAHPDDEASKGAATMARYGAEGIRTVLVTCTGGEAGDILNPEADTDEVRDNLAEVRRQ